MNNIKWNITTFSIIYLLLPVVIFFLTWLHSYIGIPATILLVYAGYVLLCSDYVENTVAMELSLSRETIGAFAIIFFYLLLTGHGEFIGAAGYDTPWRNALYNDLIQKSWPVIYEYSHSALVYYMSYWLVPAGLAHILGMQDIGSRILLFIWTYIGLLLFVGLLWEYLSVSRKKIVFITIFFLFWSGLNIVGMLLFSSIGILPFNFENEWGWNLWWYTNIQISHYPVGYMVRTTFVSLMDPYNQFIPVLLSTILVLRFRKVKGLFFIGGLVIPYSPMGFVGIFWLLLFEMARQGRNAWNKNIMTNYLKDLFSVPNVNTILTIFPIFLLYYLSNNFVSQDDYLLSNPDFLNSFLFVPISQYGISRIVVLLVYFMLQFGIFASLSYKHNQDKGIIKVILFFLLLIPLFRIGESSDLCWNASMPGFFIIMIFMMQEVLRLDGLERKSAKYYVIIVVVLLIMFTPVLQLTATLNKCIVAGTCLVSVDHQNVGGTLENKSTDTIKKTYKNFCSTTYEGHPFYLYLSKDKG